MSTPKNIEANSERGAAGWAFLVWLFGGSIGLALLVFVVLRVLGG